MGVLQLYVNMLCTFAFLAVKCRDNVDYHQIDADLPTAFHCSGNLLVDHNTIRP